MRISTADDEITSCETVIWKLHFSGKVTIFPLQETSDGMIKNAAYTRVGSYSSQGFLSFFFFFSLAIYSNGTFAVKPFEVDNCPRFYVTYIQMNYANAIASTSARNLL